MSEDSRVVRPDLGRDALGSFDRDNPIRSWVERLRPLRDDAGAALVALVVLAVITGIVVYRMSVPGGIPSENRQDAASPGTSVASVPFTTTTSTGRVTVHVAGAVNRPGLVRLRGGSRVQDALEAAGGAQGGADLDRLNLASLLIDGQQVMVVRPGEPAPPPLTGSAGASNSSGVSGGLIDINRATVAELETLPGIGPTLAAAIVSERDKRGGFDRIEDLQAVRGIGEARYAELRDLVIV